MRYTGATLALTLDERLQNVQRLFLDTAPIIYFVEGNARYLSRVERVFDRLDTNSLTGVTSPITLAECLVVPYRDHLPDLQRVFSELIVRGAGIYFHTLADETAQHAAELRGRYNLTLSDAFQFAAALESNCDAFLTNDSALRRVMELDVIVLDDVESM